MGHYRKDVWESIPTKLCGTTVYYIQTNFGYDDLYLVPMSCTFTLSVGDPRQVL